MNHDLFNPAPAYPYPVDRAKTIGEAFDRFHAANPHVYDSIIRLAYQAKARGHHKWSMKGIFEVIRWDIMLRTDEDAPRLSNNYTSRYARLVMENEPELAEFFRTKELTAL